MKKFIEILVLTGSILFLCSWLICDIIFDSEIKLWNSLIPSDQIINPYIIYWNLLRYKLIGIERCCWLMVILLATRISSDFNILILKGRLNNIIIVLLDFSFGNVIDRVFFNIHTYNWNDLVIWLFAIGYLFKNFFPKYYCISYSLLEPYFLPINFFISKFFNFLILLVNKLKSAWHKSILCLRK